MSQYSYPENMKKLLACKACRLLKNEVQWKNADCDNCGEINDNSLTANFKGIIAFTDPNNSWANKWINRQSVVPGVYCIHVDVNEDEEVEDMDDYDPYGDDEEEIYN